MIAKTGRDEATCTAARGRCFIHIGTPKTGTTSVQTFLRDNRERFAANEVLIPHSGRSENDAGHHNLALQLLDSPRFDPKLGGLAELVDELKQSDLRTACISSENFSQLSRKPDALARLRAGILKSGFTPVVVIYLRPQPAYVISIYAEIVKNGLPKPFEAYLREILEHGSFFWGEVPDTTFHYDRLLDAFASVFGRDAIIGRRYRSAASDDTLLESISALLIDQPVDIKSFALPSLRENPSLTFGGVLRKFDVDVGRKLDMELGADDLRFAPLDLRSVLRISRAFLRSNMKLFRTYGIWIPPCEIRDLYWALPMRKNSRRTRALRFARSALATFV